MATAGRILIIPRGDYNENTTYEMLDLVNFSGVTWLAKKTVTGIEPSEANSEYWFKFHGNSVANNLTTEESGYVLDARQGKALMDEINQLSSEIDNLGKNVSNYPNLLINGDFRNPVNQRASTSYQATSGSWTRVYSIDRWCLVNGAKISIKDGCIDLSCTTSSGISRMTQQLENLLPENNYTCSVRVKNVKGGVRFTVYSSESLYTSANITEDGVHTITHTGVITSVSLGVGNGESADIEWIKLEQGSIATPFIPRLYGEELALCQRYYQSYLNNIAPTVLYKTATETEGRWPLRCEMRAVPTVSIKTMQVSDTSGKLTINSFSSAIITKDGFNAVASHNSRTDYIRYMVITATVDAEIY